MKLTEADLARLSAHFERGLEGGRDWLSILKWLAENDPQKKVQENLKFLVLKLKVELLQGGLEEEKKKCEDPLTRLFLEILLQAQKGSSHLSRLFHSFSGLCVSIDRIRRKERGLLFIPKFQSMASLGMAVFFLVILPWWQPEFFPTFVDLKRYDLYGISILGLGSGLFCFH